MCWERFAANTLYIYVSTIFISEMLAAQVLQCLSVGLMCWKSFANTLYVSAIFPSEMLDAQVLVCLSVGLKCRKFCWESCANTLYVSTIFPSENLAAQVLGVRIDWFEVLEVLEGVLFRQLGECRYYYPSRDVGFLVCHVPFRRFGCTGTTCVPAYRLV